MYKDYEAIKSRNKILEMNLIEYEKLKEQYSELVEEYNTLDELFQNVSKLRTSIGGIEKIPPVQFGSKEGDIAEISKLHVQELEKQLEEKDDKIILYENEVRIRNIVLL